MRVIVIDVSVSVAWVMVDERTPFSEQLLAEVQSAGCYPVTLPLFRYEFRNMLLNNVRRRRIDEEYAEEAVRYMRTLKIRIHTEPDDFEVIRLGVKHGLTAYDASYLALAIQEGAVLATNDKQLARAALGEGVELRTLVPAEQLG